MKITNEDNMKLMARYEDNHFDLAIVDPPYGSISDATKTFTSNSKNKATKRTEYKQFKNVEPQKEYFEELIRVSKHQIIWGVNFYNNFNLSGGRICWDKKGTAFGRAELAYYSGSKSVNICEIVWNGMLQHDMKNKENRIHPTQKPVKLYEWLLMNYAQRKCDHKHEEHYRHLCTDCRNQDVKILDTHLGSGSIALACHNLGFDLTACELDKEYYEKAMKRIQEHKNQIRMF